MVIKKSNPKSLKTAVQYLDNNKLIIAPCDTIYGILGLYPGTDRSIRELKGREETKPFLVLAENGDAVGKLCSGRLDPELTAYWPGPLTIILPAYSGGTIGVRVPDDQFLQELLKAVGTPLYSTSVNRAGEQPINSIEQIIAEFEEDVDLIITEGDLQEGEPSTIVDATKSPYTILRQGALKLPF